jgi:hypothetical protein
VLDPGSRRRLCLRHRILYERLPCCNGEDQRGTLQCFQFGLGATALSASRLIVNLEKSHGVTSRLIEIHAGTGYGTYAELRMPILEQFANFFSHAKPLCVRELLGEPFSLLLPIGGNPAGEFMIHERDNFKYLPGFSTSESSTCTRCIVAQTSA